MNICLQPVKSETPSCSQHMIVLPSTGTAAHRDTMHFAPVLELAKGLRLLPAIPELKDKVTCVVNLRGRSTSLWNGSACKCFFRKRPRQAEKRRTYQQSSCRPRIGKQLWFARRLLCVCRLVTAPRDSRLRAQFAHLGRPSADPSVVANSLEQLGTKLHISSHVPEGGSPARKLWCDFGQLAQHANHGRARN